MTLRCDESAYFGHIRCLVVKIPKDSCRRIKNNEGRTRDWSCIHTYVRILHMKQLSQKFVTLHFILTPSSQLLL